MKQVTKFYLTSFLKNQTYFTPILIIFLQAQHLDFQQIFWVFTIGSILSLLIEIPTGIFADLYGKRKSLMISKFLIFVSFVAFGFSTTFWMFVASQVIFELGNSFRTGTETAYIFDYLKQNKDAPQYTEVKGKQKFWARIGESIATAAGGVIAAQFGFSSAFFAAAALAFANFVLACTWEPIKERTKRGIKIGDYISFTKSSFAIFRKRPQVLRITLNIAIFTSVLAALNKFLQPYMLDAGIPIEWFGFIYSAFLIATAITVRYSYIFENKFGTHNVINTISLLAVLPLLVIGVGYISIAGVALFFMVVVFENIRSPIANNEFHENVDSESRSTLGSMLSLSKSLGKIIMLPIAGFLADAYSMYAAILVMGIVLFANGVLFYVRKK
ncbi:MAG: MFS transporter [Candidatus Micrarchaeota archaeon]|nr:MFS transporter [Candidatus Micrarchaeota archaeon]